MTPPRVVFTPDNPNPALPIQTYTCVLAPIPRQFFRSKLFEPIPSPKPARHTSRARQTNQECHPNGHKIHQEEIVQEENYQV